MSTTCESTLHSERLFGKGAPENISTSLQSEDTGDQQKQDLSWRYVTLKHDDIQP